MISQDTSAYGVDVKYRTGFWDGKPVKTRMLELVQALGEIAEPYGAWVRLHYVYPYPSVDEVIPLMATGQVLPYLDVPLQHSHPDVLKRMKRPASGEKNLERIARWREVCPELVIRSTFIAGFPGETEAEFEHLLDFMREAQIDRAGCFAYSPVEGAAANDIPGMLPEAEREERRARFMAVAEEVSIAKLRSAHRRHHAGAGGFGAGHGPQGRRGPQLCRRAGDRRHRAAAAAREDQQDAEGRRVHPGPHRRTPKATTWSRCRFDGRLRCGRRQEKSHRRCSGLNRESPKRDYLNLVPRRGLEPPRCYSLVPETSASTNSAIWAHMLLGTILATRFEFQERERSYQKY